MERKMKKEDCIVEDEASDNTSPWGGETLIRGEVVFCYGGEFGIRKSMKNTAREIRVDSPPLVFMSKDLTNSAFFPPEKEGGAKRW